MSNTINKENAVKECSRALCNDAQEMLSYESNAAAQDTYVACGCNTLVRDLGKVAAVAGGVLASATLLKRFADHGGISPALTQEIRMHFELDEAKALFTDGKYAEAANVYKEALDVAIGLKNNDLIEAASHGVRVCYTILKDHGALREAYEKLAKYYAGQKDFDAVAEVTKKIADTYTKALMEEANFLLKKGKPQAAADKYLESAELMVRNGDLDGAVVNFDMALLTVAMEEKEVFEKVRNRRGVIFATNSMLAELDEEIKASEKIDDFDGMREALEKKIDIYQDLQYFGGRLGALEKIIWTYREQEDWSGVMKTDRRIVELAGEIEDKVERAKVMERAWEEISTAYENLDMGETEEAETARAEVKKYSKVIADAELAATGRDVKPVKAERPDIEMAKAAKIGSQVLATLKEWHEIAENMTDGGSPEQLDAASRRYEMTAHVMQAFGYVQGAREAYERAANAILAKSPLDTAELERMASLYEAATCDPKYADANFSKAGKFWFDAAQAWAKTGNIAQALGDLGRANKAYKTSNGPVEKETVLKMGVLKVSLMRKLLEKAPDVREHYQVRIPVEVIEEYLQKRDGREWYRMSREEILARMGTVEKAVAYALKHHRGEMEPFINEGEVNVKACVMATELWWKNVSRGATSEGPAVSAGVEGVARAARSEGAERKEGMERRGEGLEKIEGREEGRKGPGVKGK